MTLYGWDVSNHDWDRARAAGRTVDLANARKAGISFVTHKATEGSPAAGQYADPDFAAFAAQLAHVDFPVAGSYHATHRDHAVSQADFWFDTVTAKYPAWRHHRCWLWQIDAEPLDGYPAPTKADILALGHRLEARGIDPDLIVVYAPHWVYGDSLKGLPWRLWASSYTQHARAFDSVYPGDRAAGWGAYSGQVPLILQFSSVTTIGAHHECDANAIRVSTEESLLEIFGRDWLSMATKADVQAAARAAVEAAIPDIAKAVAEQLLAEKLTNAYGRSVSVQTVLVAVDKHVNDVLADVTPKPQV